MKQAKVWVNNVPAGILTEDDMGYEFRYDINYLKSDDAVAVSLTLPLTDKPYRDKVLFLPAELQDAYQDKINAMARRVSIIE